jgi:hypothetical protein
MSPPSTTKVPSSYSLHGAPPSPTVPLSVTTASDEGNPDANALSENRANKPNDRTIATAMLISFFIDLISLTVIFAGYSGYKTTFNIHNKHARPKYTAIRRILAPGLCAAAPAAEFPGNEKCHV